MPDPTDPRCNCLLAALPDDEWQRWRPQLECVDLRYGQALYEPGIAKSYAYFPTSSVVSILYVAKNGATDELACVGNEGIVGISIFLSGEATPRHAMVRRAGYAFRLKARVLKEEFERAGPVMHGLLNYTQALVAQMAQAPACNRHHSLDQRLCSWLLRSLDRQKGSELLMTQESIATMLGVRREGVTECASELQRAGLIRYTRGHISVRDRAGLEERACECYAVVKKEYDRLLPRKPVLQPERASARMFPAWTSARLDPDPGKEVKTATVA